MITPTIICMSDHQQRFTAKIYKNKACWNNDSSNNYIHLQGSAVQHEEPPPDKMNNLSIVTRKEDPNTNLSLNILPTQEQVGLVTPIFISDVVCATSHYNPAWLLPLVYLQLS